MSAVNLKGLSFDLDALAERCAAWHGGMGDPLYAVSCAWGHPEHWQRLDRALVWAASCNMGRNATGQGMNAELLPIGATEREALTRNYEECREAEAWLEELSARYPSAEEEELQSWRKLPVPLLALRSSAVKSRGRSMATVRKGCARMRMVRAGPHVSVTRSATAD